MSTLRHLPLTMLALTGSVEMSSAPFRATETSRSWRVATTTSYPTLIFVWV